MLDPLYVRSLTETEEVALKQGLRSKEAFTLRRCQILLASAKGIKASESQRQPVAVCTPFAIQFVLLSSMALPASVPSSIVPKPCNLSSTWANENNYVN